MRGSRSGLAGRIKIGIKKTIVMTDIYEFLDANNVSYERYDHPAVFTVEESKILSPELNGASTKNLFLRDKKGLRHF